MNIRMNITFALSIGVLLALVVPSIYAPSIKEKAQKFFAEKTRTERIVYLQKKYADFKNTVKAYQECITRKRPCTAQEVRNLRATAIGLSIGIAIAVGSVGAYAYYRSNTIHGYIRQLKSELSNFTKKVESNVSSPQLDSIRFDVSKINRLSEMIQNALLSPEEKKAIREQLEEIDTMLKTFNRAILFKIEQSNPDQYYIALEETYKKNFFMKEDLLQRFRFDIRGVYGFLDTNVQEGKNKPVNEIQELINDKIKNLRETGLYSDDQLIDLARQLGYLFRNIRQKQEYDAFLGGDKEFAKIQQIKFNDTQKEAIYQVSGHISTLLFNFLDIQQYLTGQKP